MDTATARRREAAKKLGELARQLEKQFGPPSGHPARQAAARDRCHRGRRGQRTRAGAGAGRGIQHRSRAELDNRAARERSATDTTSPPRAEAAARGVGPLPAEVERSESRARPGCRASRRAHRDPDAGGFRRTRRSRSRTGSVVGFPTCPFHRRSREACCARAGRSRARPVQPACGGRDGGSARQAGRAALPRAGGLVSSARRGSELRLLHGGPSSAGGHTDLGIRRDGSGGDPRGRRAHRPDRARVAREPGRHARREWEEVGADATTGELYFLEGERC